MADAQGAKGQLARQRLCQVPIPGWDRADERRGQEARCPDGRDLGRVPPVRPVDGDPVGRHGREGTVTGSPYLAEAPIYGLAPGRFAQGRIRSVRKRESPLFVRGERAPLAL